jgi:hypothetical protein
VSEENEIHKPQIREVTMNILDPGAERNFHPGSVYGFLPPRTRAGPPRRPCNTPRDSNSRSI